jgi:hypothetical protein
MAYGRKRTPLYGVDRLGAEAESIIASAEAEGQKAAVLGGFAMQLYGSQRLTSDLDFVADEAPRFTEGVGTISFGGVKFVSPGGIPVDWIVREDEHAHLYADALENAVVLDNIPTVTPEHLAVIKLSTGRPKDYDDLMYLLQEEGLVDVARARRIAYQYLGGKFAADEFNSALLEARIRKESEHGPAEERRT